MKICPAIAICLIALTIVVGSMPYCFAVDAIEASSKINEAESSLNLAFATVHEAENAGADIRGLLAQLKVAGDFLSEAYAEFRGGDYESANSSAVECSNAVAGLSSRAFHLMTKAGREQTDRLVLTVVGSSVGLVLLLVLGIAGWSLLKKRYYQRVSEISPEVDESP